jgi:hypothetical protein
VRNVYLTIVSGLMFLFIDLKRWATLSQFRRDLEDSLDMAIVTACKHLLSEYILENHDQQFNGTTLASSR